MSYTFKIGDRIIIHTPPANLLTIKNHKGTVLLIRPKTGIIDIKFDQSNPRLYSWPGIQGEHNCYCVKEYRIRLLQNGIQSRLKCLSIRTKLNKGTL